MYSELRGVKVYLVIVYTCIYANFCQKLLIYMFDKTRKNFTLNLLKIWIALKYKHSEYIASNKKCPIGYITLSKICQVILIIEH
jgi:hypothetical protein